LTWLRTIGHLREEDVYRLQQQVKKLYRRVRREQPPVEGLPVQALQVLGALDHSPGVPRPSELAAALQMTTSNVAAALRVLESSGLVVRRPDPADGRKAFIELTEQGKQVVEDIRRTSHTWLSRTMNELLSPQERRILLQAGDLMDRIADAPEQR
jgi:DNA-binding MarR family transcriptional regulator